MNKKEKKLRKLKSIEIMEIVRINNKREYNNEIITFKDFKAF